MITLQTLRKTNTPNLKQEDGLTLVEIMVAVIVISILAVIAVPLFAAQQKSAIEGTLKNDLRNAGMIMRNESQRAEGGRMISYLPSYATQSEGNIVTLDRSRSNAFNFCLMGRNPDLENTLYYSSYTGKMSTTACPALPNSYGSGNVSANPPATTPTTPGSVNAGVDPRSFTAEEKAKVQDKSVLLISGGSVPAAMKTSVLTWFKDFGFKEVVVRDEAQFLALSAQELKTRYEVVILQYAAWAPHPSLVQRAYEYYNLGGKVIHDGNDTSAEHSPFVSSSVGLGSNSAMFNPTYNQGLKPTFPYTFRATAFPSDASWACVTGLTNGAVALADYSVSGRNCATLYAAANNNGGRWVYGSYFYNGIQAPVAASIEWMLS